MQPQGGPKAKGSRGWVRRALTISVFRSSQSAGKRFPRRRDLTTRQNDDCEVGLSTHLQGMQPPHLLGVGTKLSKRVVVFLMVVVWSGAG